MEYDIVVEGLHKYYGSFHALKGASFKVPRGSVFGLLGPNGAGKSTTIKIIVGLLKPSGGRALVRGHPAGSISAKKLIGYAPERFSIAASWRLLDFLVYVGRLYGLSSREALEQALSLLEWVGLSGFEHERFGNLSAGMKRRLGLAQALIGDPSILVLDEPTEHLDAIGRLELLNKIRELADKGRTVFLSTHVLAEAERVVDYYAIIHKGRIVFEGSREDAESKRLARIVVDRPKRFTEALDRAGFEYSVYGNQVIVDTGGDEKRVLELILETGVKLLKYEAGSGITDTFMRVIEGGEE
ncbi:MAG: ABC transporter ATP-binding protein [Desulfurococcales archaeon]|nr:ABC transporter ATP-binding protein [Desulfurococcales archaeon]